MNKDKETLAAIDDILAAFKRAQESTPDDTRAANTIRQFLYEWTVTLRDIAGVIPDPIAPVPPSPETRAETTASAIVGTLTECADFNILLRTWRDVAPTLPGLQLSDRVAVSEAFITTLATVTQLRRVRRT